MNVLRGARARSRRRLCLMASILSATVWAQELSISGTVADSQGVIPGAAVTLKGSGMLGMFRSRDSCHLSFRHSGDSSAVLDHKLAF